MNEFNRESYRYSFGCQFKSDANINMKIAQLSLTNSLFSSKFEASMHPFLQHYLPFDQINFEYFAPVCNARYLSNTIPTARTNMRPFGVT